MSSSILICHAASNTDWVGLLVEYLKASSEIPPSFRCSYLPGYALNREDTGPTELKYEIMQADVVIAVVTPASLLDAQFILEFSTAWAFDKWVIPLLDGQLSRHDLPRPLSELRYLMVDGAETMMELAKSVIAETVDSEQSRAALDRLVSAKQERKAVTDADVTQKVRLHDKKDGEDPDLPAALRSEPVLPSEIAPAGPIRERRFPSAIESLNAGLALSDCYHNRHKGGSYSKELDKPFGAFLNALGGSWDDLRKLDDLDVYSGVTENLISTLPPARHDISHWYNLGNCMSTMLNIAGRGWPRNPRKRKAAEVQWHRSLGAFRQLAAEVNLQEREVSNIQSVLEDLLGAESKKNYKNTDGCLERLRRYARDADRR